MRGKSQWRLFMSGRTRCINCAKINNPQLRCVYVVYLVYICPIGIKNTINTAVLTTTKFTTRYTGLSCYFLPEDLLKS